MPPIQTNNRRPAFIAFKWPVVKEFLWTTEKFIRHVLKWKLRKKPCVRSKLTCEGQFEEVMTRSKSGRSKVSIEGFEVLSSLEEVLNLNPRQQ
ncbi:hypothetical protein SESBI_43150 [Sesbania bispinosa]|nr:hypothetical protein SESBI_43150 [Sesbania bispinosa]